MSYLYSGNLDPLNSFDQIEIRLDDGDTAILEMGHYYELTFGEFSRASQYVVLVPGTDPADEFKRVYYLPVKGTPQDGQVPVWDANDAAFALEALSGSGFNVVGTPINGDVVSYNGSNWVRSTRLLVVEAALADVTAKTSFMSSITDPEYGAIPGGGVDNTVAIKAAVADNAGGCVYFPPGDWGVNVVASGTIEVPDGTTLVGDRAVVRWLNTTLPSNGGFHATFTTAESATVRMKGIEVVGPTTILDTGGTPSSGSAEHYCVQTYGEGATLEAEWCAFRNATFAVWNSSHNTGVKLRDCFFYGFDGAQKSTAILFSSNGGARWCDLERCEFRGFGFDGNNFFHCLYIDDEVQVSVKNCRFYDHHGTGFYIQLHDGAPGSPHQLIKGCYFGPYDVLTGNGAKCINTSNQRPHTVTRIVDCTFDVPNQAIELDGDVRIINCAFTGDGSACTTNTFWLLAVEDDADIFIEDCDFTGTSVYGAMIDWNSSRWTFKTCRFPGTFTEAIRLDDALDEGHVRVIDTEFSGPNISDYCINAAGGGKLTVRGCHFLETLDPSTVCIRCSSPGTLAKLAVIDTEFSQPGTVATSIDVGSSRPPILEIRGNYGDTGFKTSNSGSSSVIHGGSIAHGLGSAACSITPTKYNIEPTGAGGNRIATVVGRDSTSIIIELLKVVSTTGDQVLVPENVSWWAEY